MFTAIRIAALSALVGLGAVAAGPSTAHADGIYLNFGDRGDPRFGVYRGDGDQVRDWRRDERRRDDRRRDLDWRGSCSGAEALRKARRMGLHRARIVDEGRRTIKVAGRKYSDRVVVVFGRERGCPIVYR
jgi:hypothetical protein